MRPAFFLLAMLLASSIPPAGATLPAVIPLQAPPLQTLLPKGEPATTWAQVEARLRPYEGPTAPGDWQEGLEGRLFTGYQGWFNAEGDGSNQGWVHFSRGRKSFNAENVAVEMWPDMTELSPQERYPTGFRYADGSVAETFSSYNGVTVFRHFRWMNNYGIGGAFLQRFGVSLRRPSDADTRNVVMGNARLAAHYNGVAWTIMYDLTSLKKGEIRSIVMEDWKRLCRLAKIREDGALLRLGGKPLVAIWGVGFNDKRLYTNEEIAELLDLLQHDPEYGGNAVLLGMPFWWRTGGRDTVALEKIAPLLARADVIHSWSVGRIRSRPGATELADEVWAKDLAWARENKKIFIPTIYPGFGWANLKSKLPGWEKEAKAFISREEGKFYRHMGEEAYRVGATTAYIAMFDEIDEATAIFKVTNNPPVGANFQTLEGKPSDYYLQLTRDLAKLYAQPRRADPKPPVKK
jgi:hypothetical protein